MSNIDTSSWKEFRLDELFSAESGDFDIKKEHINGLGVDVVTAGETENGILGKSDIIAKVFDGNTITIDMFGKCTYRPDCYKLVTHARVFSLKCLFDDFDEKSGLYVTTILQKLVSGFSYSNMCSWNKIKNLSIKLPVKESEEIDWDYMQERIAELEQERIAELEQYLIATGLNDYELTDEDKEILATKLTDGGALQSSTSVNGCLKEARSFKLDELFEKIQTKKICGKANDFPVYKSEEYTIPLLTAGVDNQGFARYAKRIQCPTILKNVISISANGANTGVTFYQKDEFAVLQDAYAIKLKNMEIPNKQVGLFLAACINKILHGNFSWTFKAGWERIKEMSISLPIKESGEIDWEYMEKYIKATEKVVIRDVVEWKNEIIEKTKEVVEGSDTTQEAQPTNAQ